MIIYPEIAKRILRHRSDDVVSSIRPAYKKIISTDKAQPEWHETHTETHPYKREIVLVLDGYIVKSINKRLYKGTPGTLFLFDYKEEHDCSEPPGYMAQLLYFIMLPKEYIWFLLPTDTCIMKTLPIVIPMELLKRIQNSWDQVAAAKSSLEREIVFYELCALLSELFSGAARALINPNFAENCDLPQPEAAVMRVRNYLDQNLGCGTSIRQLASLSGYSESHFLYLFQKFAGCSVQEYIDDLRIEYYLKNYKLCPVKEIALNLGFSSTSALCHWRAQKITFRHGLPARSSILKRYPELE